MQSKSQLVTWDHRHSFGGKYFGEIIIKIMCRASTTPHILSMRIEESFEFLASIHTYHEERNIIHSIVNWH